MIGISTECALLSRGFELLIACIMDLFGATGEEIGRCDVADGAVQSDGVVVSDVVGDDSFGVFEVEWRLGPDGFLFEAFVPAFDFPVRLGVVRGCSDMGHSGDSNELFEVSSDELRSVIGDDSGSRPRDKFAGLLQNDFDLRFGHRFSQIPMDNGAAASVEDGTEVIECPLQIDVGNVDMPMLVGAEWLDEARSFFGRGKGVFGEHSGLFENPIDARRTTGDDIGIDHHEGQSSISFQGMFEMELENRLSFVDGQPMIAWDPRIVLVDFSIATSPVMEFTERDSDPGDDDECGDLGLIGPSPHEIDDLIANIVRNPTSLQGSPSSFFSWMCSSSSSLRTASFRWSLAWSCSIFWSRGSMAARLGLRNAAAPFSKNSFCQL